MFSDIESLQEEVIDNLNQTIKNFRQGLDASGYNQLITTLGFLEEFIKAIAKERNNVEKIVFLNKCLSQAMKALELKDPVLLADYLEYNVLPELVTLRGSME